MPGPVRKTQCATRALPGEFRSWAEQTCAEFCAEAWQEMKPDKRQKKIKELLSSARARKKKLESSLLQLRERIEAEEARIEEFEAELEEVESELARRGAAAAYDGAGGGEEDGQRVKA